MTHPPLELYDIAISSHAGPGACSCDGWRLRYDNGHAKPLALATWCQPPDAVDRELLRRCLEPTLDVGCGPGRLVAALSAAGIEALGVDVATSAVRLARVAGAAAVHCSVFDPLPNEGQWGTVLLADGNIGIGGHPVALLRRCVELLAPDGFILAELDPPGASSGAVRVRIERQADFSNWFPWAHLAVDVIGAPAAEAGLRVLETWTAEGRWFVCLGR